MFREGNKLIGDTSQEIIAFFYLGLSVGILIGLQLMLLLLTWWIKKRFYKPPPPPILLKNADNIVNAEGTKKANRAKNITGIKETSPETIPSYHINTRITIVIKSAISKIAIAFSNQLIQSRSVLFCQYQYKSIRSYIFWYIFWEYASSTFRRFCQSFYRGNSHRLMEVSQ